MIFNYKTISVSLNVELDIGVIRNHQKTIIHNANLQSDGTLIHNEEIDDTLITLVPETVYEERLLISEIASQNFYYDDVRNRYLGLDTLTVVFYLDGSNRKNMYLYNIPGISSSSVPFRIFGEYCLISIEGYTTTPVPTGTQLAEIHDMSNSANVIVTIGNDSGSDLTDFYNDEYDIIIPPGTTLGGYMLNFGVNTPVVKLHLKKTFYPV